MMARNEPLGFSTKQVLMILNHLEDDVWCEPHEGWFKVGAALHLEFQGSDKGLELWNWYSEPSGKFDPNDSARVWKTYKSRPDPITMASLLAAAKRHSKWDDAKFRALGESQAKPKRNRGLTFVDAGRYDDLAPAFDFIPSTLQDASVAIIYGPPQSGKTFFALHLLCSTALGRVLFGLAPESRRGLYVGLEGEAGVKARIQAWCVENGVDESPIDYALGSFDIADPEQRARLIAYMLARGTQFLVLDTLARTMTGLDEIAGKDMSVVIDALHEIKRETGACVVAIAHTGKDVSAGIRGHSSQLGNVDTTIEVEAAAKGTENITHETARRARVRKQRDGLTGTEFHFRLKVHETTTINARGEPVRSVAVDECERFKDWDAIDKVAKPTKLTERERAAVAILDDLKVKYARIGLLPLANFKHALAREGWPGKEVKDKRGAVRDLLGALERKGVLTIINKEIAMGV